jgi:hypothetical protein
MLPRYFGPAALAATLALSSCTQPAQSETAKSVASGGPVVIELFQSQGCSSCPPANAALNAIAPRKDVIALSYAVTYWDRLGWKDKFADPAFTQRQYDYKTALGEDSVYTPQVVLNGSKAIVGNGKGELERAVGATRAVSGGPSITLDKGQVSVGSAMIRARKMWRSRLAKMKAALCPTAT